MRRWKYILSVLVIVSSRQETPVVEAWWQWSHRHPSQSQLGLGLGLSLDEIPLLRVRELKRLLSRHYGYSPEDLTRMLDKTELIHALGYEINKEQRQQAEERQRQRFWMTLAATVGAIFVIKMYPVIHQGYEILHVNLMVYSDRKRYELHRCQQFQSKWGLVGWAIMILLDALQLWLSVSTVLSWFIKRNKYFFPTPHLPVRPSLFLGGGDVATTATTTSSSSSSSFGINVGPMLLTWAFRWIYGRVEGWTSRTLLRAQKRQRHEVRANETLEEKRARKLARKDHAEAKAIAVAVAPAPSAMTKPRFTDPFVVPTTNWMEDGTSRSNMPEPTATAAHDAFLQGMDAFTMDDTGFDDLD